MKYCGTIEKGANILLIAPSSPLRTTTKEEIAEGLINQGYRVEIGDSLNASTAKGYAAAPADIRAKDINRGFADPDIDAIWAVRGGSMAMEVLPLLDAEVIAANPKPLLGFSDITALHIYLQEKCGITSFHAPNASLYCGETPDPYACEALERIIHMTETQVYLNPEGEPINVLKEGTCEGILAGGNLTLVASMTGTEYALNAEGKILFLEDIEEDVYRLNRMLLQLKQAGMFEKAAGVLFGAFTDCPNGYNSEFGPEDLLKEFFIDYDKPVYTGLSTGHIKKNAALPIGCKCRMENGRITFTV